MITTYYNNKTNKSKITDKIKMKILGLKEYSCKFLLIEVTSKEFKRKHHEDILIALNSKKDIDDLINKLKEIKSQM